MSYQKSSTEGDLTKATEKLGKGTNVIGKGTARIPDPARRGMLKQLGLAAVAMPVAVVLLPRKGTAVPA
jgi:hypothetical protein